MQKLVNKFLVRDSGQLSGWMSLCLFAVCLGLRLVFIGSQDVCIDEPFTIYHAQFGLNDIIHYLKSTNNPPLFEILLHYWIKYFGISAFSVRFLPALFSSLAVIYIYKSGTRFFSAGVGLTASLIYIFSTHSIYYAHDCRVYSLFLFFACASLFFFAQIISGYKIKQSIFLLCVINTLMVYSHYFGFVIWFTEFLFACLYLRNKLKEIVLMFVFAATLYLPQFYDLISRFLFSSGTGTWVKEPNGIEALYNMLWKFSNEPIVTVACILVFVAAITLFFVRKKKPVDKIKVFFIFSFVIPFLGMFLVSYKIPVFNPRYLTFLLPSYYLTVVILTFGLVQKERFRIFLPALLTLLFLITVKLDPDKKRQAKAATEFVNKVRQPNSLVIICTHEFLTNYSYYTDKKLFSIIGEGEYGAMESELRRRNIYAVRSINEIDPLLLKNAGQIIYLDAGADFSNPGNNILSTLEQNWKLKEKTHFKEIFNVYEFNRRNTN